MTKAKSNSTTTPEPRNERNPEAAREPMRVGRTPMMPKAIGERNRTRIRNRTTRRRGIILVRSRMSKRGRILKISITRVITTKVVPGISRTLMSGRKRRLGRASITNSRRRTRPAVQLEVATTGRERASFILELQLAAKGSSVREGIQITASMRARMRTRVLLL